MNLSFASFRLAAIPLAVSVSLVAASAADKSLAQAKALLDKMTLDEKIGQMTQVDLLALKDKSEVQKYFLGSMLSGGGSDPKDNTAQTWRKTIDELQAESLKTRLAIPMFYGVDAVHGHNNIEGAVVFPHNIGLGATRNARLVEQAGKVTAREVAATGAHWAFGPCVATAQNIRWGRTYESFSDDPEIAGRLGAAAVRGVQAPLPGGFRVLACSKHFAGDGGTKDGIDQGNTICDETTFKKLHVSPYPPSIKEGVASIMVSYNSWNGAKLHGHKHLLTDVLKNELGFRGFLVSDWAAIDQLPGDFKSDVEQSINAGLDMVMIPNGPAQPNNYVQFVDYLKQLVKEGKVSQARIDDAVTRILWAKFEMNLFKHPYATPDLMKQIGSAAHRKVARECVRQSLVLLKNEGKALPLSEKAPRIVVVGKAADDLGIQCGGWTIDWQGKTGAVTPGGTTILQGLKQVSGKPSSIVYSPEAAGLTAQDTAVVVIGEPPYAEMKGDREKLDVSAEDIALISKAKQSGAKVVTVILSGRPLVLGPVLAQSDALVAAWLPGTEGQGVADVLFGEVKPKGKLPRHWPKDNSQLDTLALGNAQPLFPCGYGLSF